MAKKSKKAHRQDVITKYSNLITLSDSFKDDFKVYWDKIYKMFKVRTVEEEKGEEEAEASSSLSVPTLYIYITTALAKICGTLLQEPIIQLVPQKGMSGEKAQLLSRVLQKDFEKLQQDIKGHILQTLLYEYSALKVYPDMKGNIKSLVIHPNNLYFDPMEFRKDRMEWVGNRVLVPLKTLQDNIDFYSKEVVQELTKKIEKGVKKGSYSSYTYPTDEKEKSDAQMNTYNQRVEIIEIWNFKDKKIYTIANRTELVAEQDIPDDFPNPYIINSYLEIPNEIVGMGLGKSLFELGVNVNKLRNIRLDGLYRMVHTKIGVERGKNVNEEALKSPYSGVIVKGEDIQTSIRPLVFTMPNESALDENIARQDMEKIAVAYPLIRGQNSPRKETATAMAILKQSGDVMYSDKIDYYENFLAIPLAKNLFKYHKNYYPDGGIEVDGETAKQTDFKDGYTFKGLASPRVNKEQRKAEILAFTEFINKMFPETLKNPEIQKILLTEVLQAFDISQKDKLLDIITPKEQVPVEKLNAIKDLIQQSAPPSIPQQTPPTPTPQTGGLPPQLPPIPQGTPYG